MSTPTRPLFLERHESHECGHSPRPSAASGARTAKRAASSRPQFGLAEEDTVCFEDGANRVTHRLKLWRQAHSPRRWPLFRAGCGVPLAADQQAGGLRTLLAGDGRIERGMAFVNCAKRVDQRTPPLQHESGGGELYCNTHAVWRCIVRSLWRCPGKVQSVRKRWSHPRSRRDAPHVFAGQRRRPWPITPRQEGASGLRR